MNNAEEERKMKRLFHHFTRVLLRMLPFVPGPELLDLVQDLRRTKTDLDDQVEEAITSLQKSTELVNRLEEGVRERSYKLTKLREEYEQYSKLAEIESDKASAIIVQLEQAVGGVRRRERWIGFGINLAAGLVVFFTGVALNEPVRKLLSVIAELVKPGSGGIGT